MRALAAAGALLAGSLAFGQNASSAAYAAEYAAVVAEFRQVSVFSPALAPTPPLGSGSSGDLETPWTLDDLLVLASFNNPELGQAASALDAALADLRGARARRYPSLDLETSGSFIGNPLGPISITADQFGPSVPPEDVLLYKGMENTLYDFSLIGQVPLFTWGKLKLGVSLAELGVDAARISMDKARTELGIRIRGLYDALSYLRGAEKILELQSRIGQRLTVLAEESAKAGFLTAADLANAKIKVKEVELARVRLSEQRDSLLSQLARETGTESISLNMLAVQPAKAGSPRWSEAELLSVMESGSWDLTLLALQEEATAGMARLATLQSKGLPDLGLRVELSYGGSRFPFLETDWYRQDDYQLTISLGTTGPLIGSAVKAGDAARATAEAEKAAMQSADGLRALRAYARETFLTLELSKARIEYAILKQEGWAADLDKRLVELRVGAGSETEYLSAMIEALANLAEAYGTLGEYRQGLLTLEALAGSAAAD
ncbi:MAG: TolC family protein [Spirochaetia bacterium]|nr:TolC family protein [Spirochaetia bacterium]